MKRLHIVTLALRPAGVLRAVASVAAAPSPWPVRHLVLWHQGPPDPTFTANAARLNDLFRDLPADAWCFFVDDDNLLHPELPAALAETAAPGVGAVMVGQQRANGAYLSASPSNLVPCSCDGGQVAVRAGLAAAVGWEAGPTGDGLFLQALYALAPGAFAFIDRPLSYHNAQHREHHG